MNILDFKKNYINHYLLLEKDFAETIQYVTISEDNYDTYSVEYQKLLLTICSEVDILLEILAMEYEPNMKENGFGCSKIIIKHESNIKGVEVKIVNDDLTILPWEGVGIPEWWTVYNEIKHNRLGEADKLNSKKKYYQFANQKNVLYALAALFTLEMYTYRILALKNDSLFVPTIKTMFSITNSYWTDVVMTNGYVFIDGSLHLA